VLVLYSAGLVNVWVAVFNMIPIPPLDGSVLFERLWGFTVDASRPSLRIEPQFPVGWQRATVRGVRIGSGRADVQWTPAAISVTWSGPGLLEVALTRTTGTVGAGRTTSFDAGP